MKELYDKVLSIVARQTGVSPTDITGARRTEEVTDARFLLVHFLAPYFTNKQIVSLSGICGSTVSRMRSERYASAGKYSVQISIREIDKELSLCQEIEEVRNMLTVKRRI